MFSKARAMLLVFCLASALGRESSAEQLSRGEISRVVERSRPAVRRACWEPALAARRVDGLVSARVQTSFVISSAGAVESISASGAELRFPGLSECVATSVRRLRFPSSDAPTSIKVPFLFVTQ